MAARSGKYWYSEPIDISARAATSLMRRASIPPSATSAVDTARMRSTRSRLRRWLGTRRGGGVTAAASARRSPPKDPSVAGGSIFTIGRVIHFTQRMERGSILDGTDVSDYHVLRNVTVSHIQEWPCEMATGTRRETE